LAVDLKPNLAILVPAMLLAARWHRAFFTWAGISVVLVAASVLALGEHGTRAYLSDSALILSGTYFHRWSLLPIVGDGAGWWTAVAVVVIGCLTGAWLWRKRDPGPVIAIGLIGSLLINHHLGPGDLIMILMPLWLLLRMDKPVWADILLLIGWLVLWECVTTPPLFVPLLLGLLAVYVWIGFKHRAERPETAIAARIARRGGRPPAYPPSHLGVVPVVEVAERADRSPV
jgi:hypothetical protein